MDLHSGRLSILRTGLSDAHVDELDSDGVVLSTRTLVTPDAEPALLLSMVALGERLVVGGSQQEDFFIAEVGASGALDAMVLEDHVGFQDSVAALTPVGSGFAAIVRAPTTPKFLGDTVVPQVADILVLFFDEGGQELHREILPGTGDLRAWTSIALGQGVLIAGDTAPITGTETGDWSAWAARVSPAGVEWREEWQGPVDHAGSQAIASVEAAHAIDEQWVVLGGRQMTADGVRRWHAIVDAVDGSVLEQAVGAGLADGEPDSDSYRASGSTGAAWLAGWTDTTSGHVQWVCNFEG